ncbi:hypothetical protein [Amycolatopsis nigrescens]|uniref:hypothetical protein n=1 Tax=Amycolatopsis nigrescens TaxID=381445 RepID=UPI001B7FC7F4|nr:hypothetical protein [Amycolatopsis nigrescens]
MRILGCHETGRHGAAPNALLTEMLDTWERASTDEVRARVEREGGDARVKMRRAGMLTFSSELIPPRPGRRRTPPARRQV